jgi:hypothetical protein
MVQADSIQLAPGNKYEGTRVGDEEKFKSSKVLNSRRARRGAGRRGQERMFVPRVLAKHSLPHPFHSISIHCQIPRAPRQLHVEDIRDDSDLCRKVHSPTRSPI